MSDYNRFTRVCAFEELRPELIQAIREYVQKQMSIDIEGVFTNRGYATDDKKIDGTRNVRNVFPLPTVYLLPSTIFRGEILSCCETTSERKYSNLLTALMNEDAVYYTGLLFTPQWLIWARSGDKSGIQVFSANFKDVQIKVFASKLVKDFGLELSGYMGDPPRRMKGYIGLGPEEAAQNFCAEVIKAEQKVAKAAPPQRRIKLGWW